MTTLSTPILRSWKIIEAFRHLLATARRPDTETGSRDQCHRDRRDFILEMMQHHPEAFQSELDVQNVMHCYPARF